MCIAFICFPGCDFINFGIYHIFLIKSFFYINKNSRQKFKYLDSEKSHLGEIKNIFHHRLIPIFSEIVGDLFKFEELTQEK